MTTTRTLRITLALVLFGFAFYIYLYPPTSEKAPIAINESIVASADTSSVCMDFSNYDPTTLQTGLVKDMVSVYMRNQLNAIQTGSSNQIPNDARCIMFDLDTIKKFIYHIEKGVKKYGQPGEKLGLRFYYAAYPNKIYWGRANGYPDLEEFLQDPTKANYEFKHTLVAIPAILKGTDYFDFNPFDKDSYQNGLPNTQPANSEKPSSEPADLVEIMAMTGTSETSATKSTTERIVARNHGHLYPPGNNIGIRF